MRSKLALKPSEGELTPCEPKKELREECKLKTVNSKKCSTISKFENHLPWSVVYPYHYNQHTVDIQLRCLLSPPLLPPQHRPHHHPSTMAQMPCHQEPTTSSAFSSPSSYSCSYSSLVESVH